MMKMAKLSEMFVFVSSTLTTTPGGAAGAMGGVRGEATPTTGCTAGGWKRSEDVCGADFLWCFYLVVVVFVLPEDLHHCRTKRPTKNHCLDSAAERERRLICRVQFYCENLCHDRISECSVHMNIVWFTVMETRGRAERVCGVILWCVLVKRRR